MSDPADSSWLRTSVGHSTHDSITVCGRDLATELMGHVPFADLAFLLAARSLPSPAQARMFNAILVALTDHGLTPTVLAARLTYAGAPESLQGAIAAGLLGAGSVFLGPTEDSARFLAEIINGLESDSDEELRDGAKRAIQRCIDQSRRVPGLGHPIHTEEDPRVPRLFELATDEGLFGTHLRLLCLLPEIAHELIGRRLPINAAGATGAALADLGIPPSLARGVALLARTAGLIGHLAEEMEEGIGIRLFEDIHKRMSYVSPAE